MEKHYCVICHAEIKKAKKVVFWEKKTCSPKCRLTRWALNEANKVMKGKYGKQK